MDAAIIEHEALALSAVERALLADRLLETLNVGNSSRMKLWGQEADSRLDLYEKGEASETDGPSLVANLRRRLG
jgi:hypothetical protein